MTDEAPRLVLCEENGRATFRVGAWVCPACVLDCETSRYETYEDIRRQALVRFENGWSLSIVWGPQTYSENYNWMPRMIGDFPNLLPGTWFMGYPVNDHFEEEPRFVEIAILLPERHREPGVVLTGPDGEEVGRTEIFILDRHPLARVPVVAIPELVMAMEQIGTDDVDEALTIQRRLLADD